MTEPAAPTTAGSLVPPRPNLGPEPMPERGMGNAWFIGLAVGVSAVVVFVMRNRKSRGKVVPGAGLNGSLPNDGPMSPRDRLIGLDQAVRSILIDRFGETWRAKTTEEIAEEADLSGAFDVETRDRLVDFLRAADRAKFAGIHGEGFAGAGWDDWAAAFLVEAGAKSTIKGK